MFLRNFGYRSSHRHSRRPARLRMMRSCRMFESRTAVGEIDWDNADKVIRAVENAFERAGYVLAGSDAQESFDTANEVEAVVTVESDARTSAEISDTFNDLRRIAEKALAGVKTRVFCDTGRVELFDTVPSDRTAGVVFSLYF